MAKTSEKKPEKIEKAASPTMAELKFMLYRIRRSPLSLVGVFIIVFFVIMAASAPILAPKPSWDITKVRDPFTIPRSSWFSVPTPPSATSPFGLTVDNYDIYYACVWGSITAFRVGIIVVGLSLLIGLTIGILAGYYGGLIDEVLMRFTDIIFAFPGLVLAIVFVAVLPDNLILGVAYILPIIAVVLSLITISNLAFSRARITSLRSMAWLISAVVAILLSVAVLASYLPNIGFGLSLGKLDKVLIALTLVGWPGYTRVIRGEVLRTKNEDYIEAAKASGSSDIRIMVRHIVPNAIYPILILASLDIGGVVLTAAALSFLGIGAPTNYADWGQLVQKSQDYIGQAGALGLYWYIWIIPGAFIFIFCLGWNLLGDAVRDILDPTLRRR
ncbi:MAG: ABC transporter permease [Candidatus Bathyarchaeia archaeon]